MKAYAKAAVGGLAAGSAALVTALADDVVSSAEWVTVVSAALVAAAAVWGVPNRPRNGSGR